MGFSKHSIKDQYLILVAGLKVFALNKPKQWRLPDIRHLTRPHAPVSI